MNKQTKMVFFVLICLVGVLAASTSFFAAKTYKMKSSSKVSPSTLSSASIGVGADETSSKPSAVPESQVTRAASSTEKPSQPTDTYTVQKGETLYAVASSQGTNWQDVAEANGISDANKIQTGQVLVIPKGGQVSFTVDNTKAGVIQKDADIGKYQFRLSPEETARSDAPSVYGLEITDNFILKNSDDGKAQVQASHGGKNYLITLTQPITKGEKGIWAIESIKPV